MVVCFIVLFYLQLSRSKCSMAGEMVFGIPTFFWDILLAYLWGDSLLEGPRNAN